MSNNTITASRMASLGKCARQHFWAYERGLRRDSAALPLRFGSAWARALEAIYKGADYDGALAAAIPEGVDLDPQACATVAGLLAGYVKRWKNEEILSDDYELQPEIEFSKMIPPWGWLAQGKLDLLAIDKRDRKAVIVESKTTASPIDIDSDFWLRLAFNVQVLQYVDAVQSKLGLTVKKVVYDVTKKPSIKPKMAYDLDADGKKIVLGTDGQRVLKRDGSPKETADKDKGQVVKQHMETADEFGDRLREDCIARPDFYFARREVPILDQDVKSFLVHRNEAIALIHHFRSRERSHPEQAWIRSVSELTCRSCQYKDFCLTNVQVDLAHPPAGYSIQAFNPELERKYDDSTETNDAAN